MSLILERLGVNARLKRVVELGCGYGTFTIPVARRRAVLCLAHVTNCMAKSEGDFEKGEAEGSVAVLGLLGRIAEEWRKQEGKGRAGLRV